MDHCFKWSGSILDEWPSDIQDAMETKLLCINWWRKKIQELLTRFLNYKGKVSQYVDIIMWFLHDCLLVYHTIDVSSQEQGPKWVFTYFSQNFQQNAYCLKLIREMSLF